MPTDAEKVRVYEDMFHSLHLYHGVTADQPPIEHMLQIISNWSYAHGREGVRDEAQVNYWFNKMRAREYRDSAWNSGVDTDFKRKPS
jgi:hypothetical protein